MALRRDLAHARTVQIIAAYFLPPRRLRRLLMHVARKGGRVQLVLPGKSDVPLIRLAAHSLYQRLLRAGVEIYEYQPQILHTKLVIVDAIVYAGSSNLDTRSLNINYELLARLTGERLGRRRPRHLQRTLVAFATSASQDLAQIPHAVEQGHGAPGVPILRPAGPVRGVAAVEGDALVRYRCESVKTGGRTRPHPRERRRHFSLVR